MSWFQSYLCRRTQFVSVNDISSVPEALHFGVPPSLPPSPLLPRGQCLLSKCVLTQKVVHGKATWYLEDLMIPSERLHVHGNKQLLPRTKIDIFKTSLSFSGSLAWNSLPHHLRYLMEIKKIQRESISGTH